MDDIRMRRIKMGDDGGVNLGCHSIELVHRAFINLRRHGQARTVAEAAGVAAGSQCGSGTMGEDPGLGMIDDISMKQFFKELELLCSWLFTPSNIPRTKGLYLQGRSVNAWPRMSVMVE